MTKLDSIPASLAYPSAVSFDHSTHSPGPARRLLVLVPANTDHTDAARRVWDLANALESRVQFLGLCKDAAQESGLRRQLIAMSAMVQDNKVHTEMRLELGTNWVSAVKSDLQEGDMVVCFAEQREGFLQRPLDQILRSNLSAPVYVFSGLSVQNRPHPKWLSQAAVWIGSLGIIAGSTLLQMRIALFPKDWVQTSLFILSVIVEAWMIWAWNGLFG